MNQFMYITHHIAEIDCVGWLPLLEPEGDLDPVDALPAADEFIVPPATANQSKEAVNV